MNSAGQLVEPIPVDQSAGCPEKLIQCLTSSGPGGARATPGS